MLVYSFEKPIPVAALQALLRQTTWAADRTDADVAEALAATPVQIGVWDGDRLVAYARALTDGTFRALIDDVIVDEAQRGAGIGRELMRLLLERLAAVDQVFLLAGDDAAGFYKTLGFTPTSANCLRWTKPRETRQEP